jgi:hypothetical protein
MLQLSVLCIFSGQYNKSSRFCITIVSIMIPSTMAFRITILSIKIISRRLHWLSHFYCGVVCRYAQCRYSEWRGASIRNYTQLALSLLANIRLVWNNSLGINGLAYFVVAFYEEKGFFYLTLPPWVPGRRSRVMLSCCWNMEATLPKYSPIHSESLAGSQSYKTFKIGK